MWFEASTKYKALSVKLFTSSRRRRRRGISVGNVCL